MGDYVYVSARLRGRIETVEALDDICQALVDEGMSAEGCGYSNEPDDFKTEIAEAILNGAKLIQFEEDQCNYGNLGSLEAACEEHGVAYEYAWDAGGGFAAGRKGFVPGEGEISETTDGDDVAIPLSELRELLRGDDPLPALRARVEKAGKVEGAGMPGLSASDIVITHLKAWLEDGETATALEIAALRDRRSKLQDSLDGSSADAIVTEAIGKIDARLASLVG